MNQPGSLFKYFQERGGPTSAHGGPIQWVPNGEFPPLRGVNQIALTAAEVDAIEQIADFHCKQFDLWDPEQLKAYEEIQDRAANGWYLISFIARNYVPEHNGMRIYVEWSQIYGEIPRGKVPFELRGPVAPPALHLQQAGT